MLYRCSIIGENDRLGRIALGSKTVIVELNSVQERLKLKFTTPLHTRHCVTIPEKNYVREFSGYLVYNYISKEALFHLIFGLRIQFLVKGLQMHVTPSTQSLTNHFHHQIQIHIYLLRY